MKRSLPIVSCCALFSASTLLATPLIKKNTEFEKLADGFTFTEGPAVAPDGKIFFCLLYTSDAADES